MGASIIIALIFLSAALGALALHYADERNHWRARYENCSALVDTIIEQASLTHTIYEQVSRAKQHNGGKGEEPW